MRVLVTGVSGFIGSRLVPMLARRGHTLSRPSRARLVDPASYSGCEAVVHLANIAHANVAREYLWQANVEGTRRVAQLAAKQGIRRFVYVSSIKASGEETQARAFDGTEAPHPADEYGRAKLAAERAVFEVAAQSGLEAVVVRPPLVYGPGVRANFLRLMQAVARGWPLPFANIENRRSMIYVENLADAIACCVESPGGIGRTFVVSDAGAPFSTPRLCRTLGESLGRPARLFAFPPRLLEAASFARRLTRSLEVDAAAIRSELGWSAPHAAEGSLEATARWYLGR